MHPAEFRETEDALRHLGWTELFAYLCPGAITLLSIALWTQPDLADVLGVDLAKNEFVTTIAFLLISYAIGLMIATFSEAGANRYLDARLRRKTQRKNKTQNKKLKVNVFSWPLLTFFFWLPQWRLLDKPESVPQFVRERLRLHEELERCGLRGLTKALTQWTIFATYRMVVAERLPQPARLLFRETESVHRRRLFALGVATAFMLLSVQVLIKMSLGLFSLAPGWRITHWLGPLVEQPSLPFILLALTAAGASFGLRYVAGRLLEYESLLTFSKLLSLEDPVTQTAAARPWPGWKLVTDTLIRALHERPRR
jgi:hypothetical protein